jgi:class 3 adenylate cyclase/tetratricopeptide (TPR) repeat protein
MKCLGCQAENRHGRRFCAECGAPLASTCPACGFSNEPGEKFCGGCGASLTPAPTASKFPSPESYTPKHLAERILTSRAALEGERKQVTVLFADLKGSMELLADRDPEEARKILDPVLERMMEAVHRYEGTVNQVMGDGIMALFGAPLAHEDHAVRACYAALDMQSAIGRHAAEVRASHGVDLRIRVGVNSGEVVVRAIGSDLRIDYTAVGRTTHLAARMEQLADPGTTLLTAETVRLAEGYVAVHPRRPVTVKGLDGPVETFELAGTGLRRSRLHAAATRRLTPLIGRDAELEELRQALARAAAADGQVVALIGEPGVGKSRLVWEVTHSPHTHGWLVLHVGSVSYGKATPYRPVIELLRSYFQIGDRDDEREARAKVTGRLLTLDRMLASTSPEFLTLLDVPVDDIEWQTVDPPQRRRRTLEAVKRLLLRESHVQPLLLVFENLHWADSETQAVLDDLVESMRAARVLLLVNYRPEYTHRWGDKSCYTEIRLDPLQQESAQGLLRALLGDDSSLQPLERLLIGRTEGNPFFLEESVHTLAEARVLAGEQGAYRLVKTPETIQVPATVQAMLAARIDRLRAQDKRLLQSAAVIGKDAPFMLLQAIVDLPDQDLRDGLDRLQAADFLYETRPFPDLEYTFKHALTHEVAYGSLLHERRRALHVRIVEAIETLHANRLPEHVDRLADHAFRGEAWEKAVTYLRQAGAKSVTRSAYRQATTYLRRGLRALTHLPRNRHSMEQALDLHLEIRTALVALGEIGSTLDHLREAEALAESLGDRRRLARVMVYTTSQLWLIGRPDQAVEAGMRAVAIASESDDVAVRAAARFCLALGHEALGDYRGAIESLEWSLRSLQGDQAYDRRAGIAVVSVLCHAWLVWCLSEIGRFTDALAHGREALRIAETANQPSSLVFARRAIGLVHLRKGELERALPALEAAFELCRSEDLRTPFDVTAALLGHAYTLSGYIGEALPLMEQAVADPGSTGSANHPLLLTCLGEGYLIAGHPVRALEVAKRALALAHDQRERGNEAWVLRLLAEIATHADAPDPGVAGRAYREAIARAEELGMRPLVAHCHFGLAKLYWRTGRAEQAQEHLATATAMYREMDMQFWLEQAAAEMRELR